MGRISEETIEKIIQSNNIVDVVSEFVPLKRSGRNFMGVCPFHNDKGPSLSVSPDKQLFHCFGCGASGNTLGFIMKIRNIDFIDAIKFLGEKVGISIESVDENPELQKERLLKEKIYHINVEAARFYFKNLLENKLALNYLTKRGLDIKTIKKFGLGYSLNEWGSLYKHLKSKGYSEEIIFKAGLLSKKENNYYDKFRNRIMFPVFDTKNRIIGFGGRVLDDSKPKYLNSPETPVFVKGTNLYGLNFVIKSGLPENIIIVEGYMDCISLHQYGINNAVASLGTALTVEQAKLLKRYSKNIYICYDADAAGQTATLRGLDILASTGCDVNVITIPKGKDPDEFIKAFGVEEFKKITNNALPVVDYRIIKAKDGKNLKDTTQKSIFVSNVSQILSGLDNEIKIQAYANKVFDETGIDVKTILNEVKKIKDLKDTKENNRVKTANNKINGNPAILEPAYKKSEKELLRFCILENDYFNYIRNKISVEEFITECYRITANFVFNKRDKGEEILSTDLLSQFKSKDDISDVSKIFIDEQINEDPYKLIDDYVRTLKKINIENRINDITFEIKQYEGKNEISKSANLFQELISLRKQLNLL